ncbi:MAG: rhodanese-like domain-containing protein, partial [Planctomycetota bacterium]|nr:rhodanese-like domain-containing protein [Planctomycetota bacterium]
GGARGAGVERAAVPRSARQAAARRRVERGGDVGTARAEVGDQQAGAGGEGRGVEQFGEGGRRGERGGVAAPAATPAPVPSVQLGQEAVLAAPCGAVHQGAQAGAQGQRRSTAAGARPHRVGERLPAATNYPYSEVAARGPEAGLPSQYRGKTLYVVCESGILSASATRKLVQLGAKAFSIEGGMQAWTASLAPQACAGTVRVAGFVGAGAKKASMVAFRESPRYEQWAAAVSGFTLKPLYMLLSLILAGAVWKRPEADLVALRWALLFFFVGEAFCYANFFVYRDASYLFEYLHSYGMVLAAAFATFALFEGMDARLIRLSARDAKCAALPLCRPCGKHTGGPCGLQRVFMVLIPACAVLALLPFTAEPVAVSYNTLVCSIAYNYSHPVLHQLYEIRVCPALAIVLMTASWLVLILKKNEPVAWAKVLFSAGLGFLLFGYLRLLLFAPFRDNLVWFGFWEEVTEFVGIAAVGILLLIFRKGLFPKAGEASST